MCPRNSAALSAGAALGWGGVGSSPELGQVADKSKTPVETLFLLPGHSCL